MVLLPQEAEAYGLERWSAGARWHYRIATVAARVAGFGEDAAHLFAWNDDSLDMYLNHPLWDVHDFHKGEGHWRAAHFDDLFTPAACVNTWQRTIQGCHYGLLWAAERKDPLAAFVILATAAHAIEDFYSHSTWVNDAKRRARTPFELTEAELRQLPAVGSDPRSLWSGGVIHEPPADKSPHGGHSVKDFFAAALASDDCKKDRGINLDRSCSAKVSTPNRRMTDAPGWSALFLASRTGARNATRELLERMGRSLKQAGHGAFWKTLQHYRPATRPTLGKRWKTSHFDKRNPEGLSEAPWGFITGGRYAPEPGWHLRIQIETKDGTDGRVHLQAGSRKVRLDHPRHDDFEKGDRDVYYHGPFADFKKVTLSLENRGILPAWKVAKITILAYRIGARPAYGTILSAEDVALDNGSKSWTVSLPQPRPYEVPPFKQ